MNDRFRIGLALPSVPPFGDLLRGVALARDLALDVVSVSDHLAEFSLTGDTDVAAFEAQTVLGASAHLTGPLRLGVGVTDVLRRHPVVIAQAMLTLSHLTERPPILGIGAGERMNTRPYGFAIDRPVGRLEEALGLIRAWFDGDPPTDLDGLHFRLSGARLDLRAAAGNRPSIWIGAHGPRMLELTGRYGDGWYPADVIDPDAYAVRLVEVRRAADRADRDPASIVPAGELVVIARETDAAAEAELGSSEARLAGLLLPASAWAERGLRHPLGETFRGFVDFEPTELNRVAAELVPPELVGDHVLWGTPATIGRKVRALAEAGLRHVNLNFGPITPALVDGASVARVVEAIRGATRSIG